MLKNIMLIYYKMDNKNIYYGKDINTGAIEQIRSIGNVLLQTTIIQPAGIIQMYGGSTAPTNWLLCDGSAVSRTTYSNLFTAIGTNYGVGNGSTTFNLPNLTNRMPIGKGTGSFATLNNTGGAETFTLATTNLPAHQHYIGINTYASSGVGDDVPMASANNYMQLGADTNGNTDRYRMTGRGDVVANAGLTSSTGSGTAFNKMSPYIVVNFIIYTGIY
jgi:microcystin-dependent protein